ncbi:tautomerase family protein [Streptococcus equinus]|uniref:tautomerase family protein n=1 Tax=Streptococcus equinus TaxID=1335 RepID=UPI003BF7CFE2
MPVINISGPKLSLEQKRQLVKRITEESSKIMKFQQMLLLFLLTNIILKMSLVQGNF